jgi:acetyltransferase-like isoleucine patch superfamily enzyme
MKQIEVEELVLGQNVVIEDDVVIRGISGKAKKVVIGDNAYIGKSVQIICDEFEIGDYSKIHHDTNVHGYLPCKIGHNAWIGQYSIIDSIGGTTIGNNCGIGAHSQLWSHIKYGDTLEGCRFNSKKNLVVGNDVWFVGHCIVSPIRAEDKSMAMVGSVVTKDMMFNTIYAGSPAKPISDKIGPQFEVPSVDRKIEMMKEYLKLAGLGNSSIRIVGNVSEIKNDGNSYFAVSSREYLKTRSGDEIKFMKYLLPEKAKFVPLTNLK